MVTEPSEDLWPVEKLRVLLRQLVADAGEIGLAESTDEKCALQYVVGLAVPVHKEAVGRVALRHAIVVKNYPYEVIVWILGSMSYAGPD